MTAQAGEPRGGVVTAAISILADGKRRSAEEILAVAVAQKLVPATTTKKYVYTALIEYIARAIGHGRIPAIAQDPDREFRINEPLDDWPDLDPLPAVAPLDATRVALLDRVTATSRGDDPAAFELAACDAFAALGFATTHVGGLANPDGYADAKLGLLGYRVMLECKTAKTVVTQPDAYEASKYRTPYKADYCTLIGPAFSDEQELTDELHTHGVTAVTVDDLRLLLTIGATALDVRSVLKPGFASDALSDLMWERMHGERKRVAVICKTVRSEGWKMQETVARQSGASRAARFTVDVAMVLVDAMLRDAGSAESCQRDDVVRAFAHLTDTMIGDAVWADDVHDAIVILRP